MSGVDTTSADGLSPHDWRLPLQQGLPGFAEGRLTIESLVVSKQRRSTSRRRHPHPLALCVDLEVIDHAHRRRGTQRLYGKAYRDGASAAAWQEAQQQAWATPGFGAAVAHLPAHDMLWWAWPNDPGLLQLPTLLTPGRTVAGQPVREVQVLRHEPECRATLRCTLADGQVVYGKTFADGRGALVMARFAHAWQTARHDAWAPLVAEPLGYEAPTHTFWQAAAPGVPLMALPHDERLPLLHGLGRALARLQAGQEPPLAGGSDHGSDHGSEHGIEHWLREAARRAEKIARAQPPLAHRAQALLHRLQVHAAPLAGLPLTRVHGDFHPDQVWAHEGRPLLFDFDEFALGQPMEDLAAFITRLRQQAEPAAQRRAAEQALCRGHREAAPPHWHPAALQWHLTLQALLQASRAFVFQVPDWPRQLEHRLCVAEACAAQMAMAPATSLEEHPA